VLSGRELAAVCDRLSRDLRRYATGLPDLFLTHPERERVLLAEVKAPGDVLRPEQRGWLLHLAQCGIPATVLRLEWKSS
ncbi:MAG: VRR-NUC domain-containing protein, partial [Planctomycetota bacterium]